MPPRRKVLRALAGAALLAPAVSACDLLDFEPDPPPPPDPLTPFYERTLALTGHYDAAIGAGGPNQATLTAIRDNHRAHAAALVAIMSPRPPSPSPSPPVQPSGPLSLKDLEKVEWQAAVEACLAATKERGVLLGEIAAARACHLEVLT